MRTRAPCLRTEPSSTCATSRLRAISPTDCLPPLKAKAEVRDATLRPSTADSTLSSSSEMPSAKYSFSGSGLMFENGSTAIEARGGSKGGSGAVEARAASPCDAEASAGVEAAGTAVGTAPGFSGTRNCSANAISATTTTPMSVRMSRRRPRCPLAPCWVPSSRCTPAGPTSNTHATARLGMKPITSSAMIALPTQSGAPMNCSTTEAICRNSQPSTRYAAATRNTLRRLSSA